MHDNLLSDKNKFSKINLTIKANQFYCVCVCVFDFDFTKFSLSIIRFSINVPNVSSSFVVIVLNENAHLLKIKTIRFLVNTLEQKAEKQLQQQQQQ